MKPSPATHRKVEFMVSRADVLWADTIAEENGLTRSEVFRKTIEARRNRRLI
jgi:hypothetical protein